MLSVYVKVRMLATNRTNEYREVIQAHWLRVFNFAFRMTLDRDEAAVVVLEAFSQGYHKDCDLPDDSRIEAWLFQIANGVVEKKLSRTPDLNFDILDDTLRNEATRTDIVRSLNDPERDFMLWELKQGCMTSVINCLPPGERAAFVLSTMLQMSDVDAANTLGISKSAYKVRLSRAKKKVADYLAPRCEHVDPMNPCRCPARIGTALNKGFIRRANALDLRKPAQPFGRYGAGPNQEDAPLRDVVAIYSNLPAPDPPEDLEDKLLAALTSWAS